MSVDAVVVIVVGLVAVIVGVGALLRVNASNRTRPSSGSDRSSTPQTRPRPKQKTAADLVNEYQALVDELTPSLLSDGAATPTKLTMSKLSRLARLSEIPETKAVVDTTAVLKMLEVGIACIDDVYGEGNATGQARLVAFGKSAKKLRPRKRKEEASARAGGASKARSGKFGLPFDVDAFAAHFPPGWTLVEKLDDETCTLLEGPDGARIGVAPHQLKPSTDLFEIVASFPANFEDSGDIAAFTSSIGAQGWVVEVKDGDDCKVMLELWGPALMSVRFGYDGSPPDPAIKAVLQQAAANLVWLNAAVSRSDALPVKGIKDLHRHIRGVLKVNEELRDQMLASFDNDAEIALFVHELEAVAEIGPRAYPLVRALIRYAIEHEADIGVDDLCTLQDWCGVHFLNDQDLKKLIAQRAESTAESTRDFLELATAARASGDSAREESLMQSALAAAKSTDDHLKVASHPVIAPDPTRVRALLDAALAAATDVGDLREVLDHDAAGAHLLPPVLERLRTSCAEEEFLSSAWNPLDVLRVACNKGFMDSAAAEAEILALVDGSTVLSGAREPTSTEALPAGDEDSEDDGAVTLPDMREVHGPSGDSMHLLSLAESAGREEWDGLRETLLARAMAAASTPGRTYAVYEFLRETLKDQPRADVYLEANRAKLQPFLDEKQDAERYEQLMDAICQCALLVAAGDGRVAVEETEEIQKVRPIVEMMYRNRNAIAILEQTEDIDKAREARGPMILVHTLSSMWLFEPAYSREISEALSEVSTIEQLNALLRMYAARLEDPLGRRLAAWAATEVASADGLDEGEQRVLKIMSAVWGLDIRENQRWFRDFVYPVMSDNIEFTGRSEGSLLEQARKLDSQMRDEGGDDLKTLAEALGVDSMEDLVRILGKEEEEDEEVEDTVDFPAAFLAVLKGLDWDEALRLVAEGADINETINMGGIAGLSLLSFAAEHGTVDVVRALVAAGADVNQGIKNPLHVAGYNTPLVTSLKGSGRMDIFDYLLEAGANPDPFGDCEGGWTPLTIAASNLNHEAVKTLIDLGVDVNVARYDGSNAFKILGSSEPQNFPSARKCMELLLKAGIDTSRVDNEGFAGIHNAVCKGPTERIAYLVETAKVPVDLPRQCLPGIFHTPLLRAMEWGNLPVVDYLLAKGADPAARSKGATALGIPSVGIFSAIATAGIDGSLPEPIPQLHRFLALGVDLPFDDIRYMLSALSEAGDDDLPRLGAFMDEFLAAGLFGPEVLQELDAEDIQEKITKALGAAPEATTRFLVQLKKRGIDLESIMSKTPEESLIKATATATENTTPMRTSTVEGTEPAPAQVAGKRRTARQARSSSTIEIGVYCTDLRYDEESHGDTLPSAFQKARAAWVKSKNDPDSPHYAEACRILTNWFECSFTGAPDVSHQYTVDAKTNKLKEGKTRKKEYFQAVEYAFDGEPILKMFEVARVDFRDEPSNEPLEAGQTILKSPEVGLIAIFETKTKESFSGAKALDDWIKGNQELVSRRFEFRIKEEAFTTIEIDDDGNEHTSSDSSWAGGDPVVLVNYGNEDSEFIAKMVAKLQGAKDGVYLLDYSECPLKEAIILARRGNLEGIIKSGGDVISPIDGLTPIQTALTAIVFNEDYFNHDDASDDLESRFANADEYRDALIDIAKILLKAGADVNLNVEDMPIISLIESLGDAELSQLCRAGIKSVESVGDAVLSSLAERGDLDGIKEYIRLGVSVNPKEFSTSTPLMYASQGPGGEDEPPLTGDALVRQENIVKLLLSRGAEVNAKTEEGHTAIGDAVRRGNASIVQILLDAGAITAGALPGNQTLLSLANRRNHADVIRILEKAAKSGDAKQAATGDHEDNDSQPGISVELAANDDEDDDRSDQVRLPFEGKNNSFIQASMCIYQTAAGDGYFNDEEIEGFIAANEALARLYELPEDVDLIQVGVKAQKIVDAKFARYSPIPLDLIHRNARQLAGKIDDPFLRKVIVFLALTTADADDDFDEHESEVLNIYLDEWNLTLDEVQEVDGAF